MIVVLLMSLLLLTIVIDDIASCCYSKVVLCVAMWCEGVTWTRRWPGCGYGVV
ncbi:hypothetical protein RND81_12G066400 [Saponaria officinalis]|uniref:Uncharacterized protein n=1 Tax=Saponaria officinalis TaxID=3572 RepID=A0AAW1H7E2_SAPOF